MVGSLTGLAQREVTEFTDILRSYGLDEDDAARIVKSIKANKKRWVDFMMRFELGLEERDPKRARRSALIERDPAKVSGAWVFAKTRVPDLWMSAAASGSNRDLPA